MAIPLVTLWATGHLDLSLYATFGAFTALYGRSHSHLTRLRMQSTAGVALIATVGVGAAVGTSDARAWLIVPVTAAITAVTALLSDACEWHPPGPLFFVFAVAACASVPTDPAGIGTALLVATGSAVLSLLIGLIGYVRPSARRRPQTRFSISLRAALAKPGQASRVARLTVGVLVAGFVPTVVGVGHPYWAMVAVVAALSGPDASARLLRAGHRILGTAAGVGLAAALFAAELPPLGTIVAAVLLQMLAELFIGRNYGVTMVFVTPLALSMIQLAHSVDGGELIADRLLETIFGAAIGIAITVLWRPRSGRVSVS